MFAGQFASDLVEFAMMMFYILLAFSNALHYIYKRLPEQTQEVKAAESVGVAGCDEDTGERLGSFSTGISSMYTLFFAMLGSVEIEDFKAIKGSLFALAMILIITFVCIQAIVMLNVLIAILGDGFDRVRSNEDATRLFNFARYMVEWDIRLSSRVLHLIRAFAGSNWHNPGYLYVIQRTDLSSTSAEWTGRIAAIREHVDHATNKVLGKIQDVAEKQEALGKRIDRMEGTMSEILRELKENRAATAAQDQAGPS